MVQRDGSQGLLKSLRTSHVHHQCSAHNLDRWRVFEGRPSARWTSSALHHPALHRSGCGSTEKGRGRIGPPRTSRRSNQIASGLASRRFRVLNDCSSLITNGKCDDHYATSNGDRDAHWCSDGDHYATRNQPQLSQRHPSVLLSAHEYRSSVPSRLRMDLKRYLRLRSRQRARSATAIFS
jgi:hypothetical protein